MIYRPENELTATEIQVLSKWLAIELNGLHEAESYYKGAVNHYWSKSDPFVEGTGHYFLLLNRCKTRRAAIKARIKTLAGIQAKLKRQLGGQF